MPICKKAKEIYTDRKLDFCKVTFTGSKPNVRALLINPHPVDLLRYFGGDVKSVNCIGKYDSSANEESITALIEFESGVAGVLIFNNQSGGSAENVELHGGGYSVIVDMISQTTRIMKNVNDDLLTPQEWIEYRPSKWDGFLRKNGFTQQDEHFIECVRTRKQPLYTAQDAYKSHELVNEIYKKVGLPTF
jgi:virulence factor